MTSVQSEPNCLISTNCNNMKTLIIITILAIAVNVNANDTEPTVELLNTEKVTVVTIDLSPKFFLSASFDTNEEVFHFTTKQDIDLIQIFNTNGDLEFTLPVMSNIVKISKNLFGKGQYNLGFLINGESAVKFSRVTVK